MQRSSLLFPEAGQLTLGAVGSGVEPGVDRRNRRGRVTGLLVLVLVERMRVIEPDPVRGAAHQPLEVVHTPLLRRGIR